jgi:hypothetical protein
MLMSVCEEWRVGIILATKLSWDEYTAIRKRIFEDAAKISPEYKKDLTEDDMYGAPYSFWGSALTGGLITQEEYDRAKVFHGSNWNYRGD